MTTGPCAALPTDGARARRMAELVRAWLVALAIGSAAFASAAIGAVLRKFRRARPSLVSSSLPTMSSHLDPQPEPSHRAPNRGPFVRDEGSVAVSCALQFSTWASSTSVRGERDEPFLLVPVVPWFCPKLHPEVLAKLQTPAMSKLLDLTQVQKVEAETFADLAAVWTAPATATPRLGILVSFERWATLRDAALAALEPLVARGIRLQVFYEEQAWGSQLDAWFRHNTIVHNLPAAIAKLGRRWEPSASWPTVIDTLARLVRAHTHAAEIPALLTEIAEIALSCGGDERAAMLAHEALFYLCDSPCAAMSKALRVLGATHMAQGQTDTAMKLLDRAIAMAAAVKAPAIEASALCQNGLISLNHGDYVKAERWFRRAIDLLVPSPQLLAVTHHHLALALMFQGSDEAEHHARTALALRSDPQSHLAEADRILLARLRATAHPRVNE